jgi:hypothetical protein
MNYDVDDLLDAEAAGELKDFFDQHRGLHRLGLSILKRWAGDSVRLSVAGSGFQILGFTSLLEGAIAQNAAKLGEARPRETHLAVLVFRWDLSDDPTETPPPTLPEEVDALWVVHPDWVRPGPVVWLAHRGDKEWRITVPARPR